MINSLFDKNWIERSKEKLGLTNLSSRERIVLLLGGLFAGVFLLFQVLIFPYLDARKGYKRSIELRKSDLVKIAQLQAEYQGLQKQNVGRDELLSSRSASFSLFSFLDRQAELANVKEQITHMKPSVIEKDGPHDESVVEMKLQLVALSNLVAFLTAVESEDNVVHINRLSIQSSSKQAGLLDVVMQVITYIDKG